MFDINLGVFKDQGYTRPYGDQSFPIGVKVNERVFLQLSVDSEDRRLAVQAQRCHATPDPNPNSTIQYNLILNGWGFPDVTFYLSRAFQKTKDIIMGLIFERKTHNLSEAFEFADLAVYWTRSSP